jgi:hypothetical protein
VSFLRRFRRNLDPAGTAPNDVGPHPTLDYGFPCLNFSETFVSGAYNPISDNLLFAHVYLRLLLCGQGRTETRYFVVFQRTLCLPAPYAQPIKLGDEILCLDPQFLGQ